MNVIGEARPWLWVWLLLVVLHAAFRLWRNPGSDPVRPSGPPG